ncbi:MAG: NAD(P)H-dependent oxidoreductase subunit E, partial [Candidatus Desulfacyla sp.]
MMPQEIDWTRISSIIEKHKGEPWGLIPLLQDIQEAIGYIPPKAIEPISEALRLLPAISTFQELTKGENLIVIKNVDLLEG